jgi:hypothetical protein
MDPNSGGGTATVVKKHEDDEKPEKRDIKPMVKTLNRVPRMYFALDSRNVSYKTCSLGACVSPKLLCAFN